MAENELMEASNGSEFLPLFAILGWLGLKISWLPVRVGKTELGLETGLGELNLDLSSDLMLRGVALSLLVRLTFPGVSRKMCTQLRAVSVTLAFGRTVWRGLKMSCTPITSAGMSRLISPMITRMIFGTKPADQ